MALTDLSRTNFEEFKKQLRHYGGLWKSARVFAAAANVRGVWILIASRIILTEHLPDVSKHQTVEPTEEFFAFIKDIPYELFPDFLINLLEKDCLADQYLHPATDNEIVDVQLDMESQNWEKPYYIDRPGQGEFVVRRRSILFVRAGGPIEQKIPPEILAIADRKIGLKYPYQNLTDLFLRLMPGMTYPYGNRMLQVVAHLPFAFEYSNEDSALTINAPSYAFSKPLQLSLFFSAGNGQSAAPNGHGIQGSSNDGTASWTLPIEWPQGERFASARLYYQEEFVDKFEFTRWRDTTSVRIAVDRYFDAAAKQLQKDLNSPKTDDFEYAVARLLNLVGIPAIWYGHEYQDRSDVAAVFQKWTGANVVLLVECTRLKPSDKFTPLMNRAAELQRLVGTEAEVVPIVFIPGAASTTDFEQAASNNLTLADGSTITDLIEISRDDPAPRKVIEILQRNRIPYPYPPLGPGYR